MSKPDAADRTDFAQNNTPERKQFKLEQGEQIFGWIVVFLLMVLGITCLFLPAFLYTAVLNLSVVSLVVYGLFNIVLFILHGKTGRAKIMYGVGALAFGIFLMFNTLLPEWIIRVCFGTYCVAVSASMFIQAMISHHDHNKVRRSVILFGFMYGLLGVLLLATDIVTTQNLIRIFGCYFCLLAIRFGLDLFDRTSSTYEWKRRVRVSLPTILATVLPDFALKSINAHMQTGREYPLDTFKKDQPVKLRAMVHIGPEGFQKVGHFTFSWKGMVYSYGNYDEESKRFVTMLGDGVFFNVPAYLYLPNIVKYEKNTIFEYGIQTTPEQDEMIEKKLEALHNRSFRWYSQIERKGRRGLEGLEDDYPSRLHYRTGAKFYKIKHGCFKTYWVMGENCVQFADVILGRIGADVLSMRGIVTPGAYYDYLESEYTKEKSPVIERRVYSPEALKPGI